MMIRGYSLISGSFVVLYIGIASSIGRLSLIDLIALIELTILIRRVIIICIISFIGV